MIANIIIVSVLIICIFEEYVIDYHIRNFISRDIFGIDLVIFTCDGRQLIRKKYQLKQYLTVVKSCELIYILVILVYPLPFVYTCSLLAVITSIKTRYYYFLLRFFLSAFLPTLRFKIKKLTKTRCSFFPNRRHAILVMDEGPGMTGYQFRRRDTRWKLVKNHNRCSKVAWKTLS